MGTVITSTGIALEVSGISRKVLDAFLLYRTQPEPPLKTVKAYKGFEEEVPDYDDPVYQDEYKQYVTALALDRFGLIVNAVTFSVDPLDNEEFHRLIQANVIDLSSEENMRADFLRFIALKDLDDMAKVMDEILYLSTVTQRGIDEAGDLFQVFWLGKRVELFGLPGSKAKYATHFEDREVAKAYYIPWNEFVMLSGPEQSAFVCHHRLRNRLEWLETQDQKTRK